MEKELIEVVDRNGVPTGEVFPRSIIHDNNLIHKEVALFIFNSKKQILLQKRSNKKRFNPNKWEICGGHVAAYEDNTTALLRELKEELGVSTNKNNLRFLEKFFKDRETNSHITYFYYMILEQDVANFIIQEEELSDVKWFGFEEFVSMINEDVDKIVFKKNVGTLKLIKMLNNILENI